MQRTFHASFMHSEDQKLQYCTVYMQENLSDGCVGGGETKTTEVNN